MKVRKQEGKSRDLKRDGSQGDPEKDQFVINHRGINTDIEFDNFLRMLRQDFGGSYINGTLGEDIKAASAEFSKVGTVRDSPAAMNLLRKASKMYASERRKAEEKASMDKLKKSPGGYN